MSDQKQPRKVPIAQGLQKRRNNLTCCTRLYAWLPVTVAKIRLPLALNFCMNWCAVWSASSALASVLVMRLYSQARRGGGEEEMRAMSEASEAAQTISAPPRPALSSFPGLRRRQPPAAAQHGTASSTEAILYRPFRQRHALLSLERLLSLDPSLRSPQLAVPGSL